MDMNRNGIERNLVVLLFVMVLVVFSFAQRDTQKLDRLYKTTHLIQKNKPVQTVQGPSAPAKAAHH
ncbi:MAG TPA: hypothetical protein VGN63_17940 [Flavisolibacter sp.]|jgi:hypothetical protein|nr:hypothetical protein [Flavisolibacter sp.]